MIDLSELKELLGLIERNYSINISTDQLKFLYVDLGKYSAYQIKNAISKVCSEVEKIPRGTSLSYLIKQRISASTDAKKPIGWICSKCQAIVPLTELHCECEFVGILTLEEKVRLIENLKALGCPQIANDLANKIKVEVNMEGVPF